MSVPLSLDLRKRIIQARESGHTVRRIATDKAVSMSAIEKLLRLYKATGSYEPRKRRYGKKSCLTPELLAKIEQKINAEPDMTLLEIIEEFKLPICESMLSKVVKNKLQFRYKKNSSRQWEKQAARD